MQFYDNWDVCDLFLSESETQLFPPYDLFGRYEHMFESDEGQIINQTISPPSEGQPLPSFSCEFCSKAFFRKRYLVDHLNIHTGKRPYACKFCEKGFTQRASCNRHMKLVHPELVAVPVVKTVFVLLGNLGKELKELKQIMSSGRKKFSRELPHGCPTLPLREVEDMAKLESFLKDKEAFNQLRTSLSTTGGFSVKDCTKRILQKLISNPLSRMYNWKGSRGNKLPFSGLTATNKLISGAVRLHSNFEAATDVEVFDSVKKWLMHSADRDGGRSDRKNP